jgi:hypothetical protein
MQQWCCRVPLLCINEGGKQCLIFLKKYKSAAKYLMVHFIDIKGFYVARFNKVPCVTFIGDMDVSKAFAFVNETYYKAVKATYQHSYFNHDEQKDLFQKHHYCFKL